MYYWVVQKWVAIEKLIKKLTVHAIYLFEAGTAQSV
jgi:hypothetical protein